LKRPFKDGRFFLHDSHRMGFVNVSRRSVIAALIRGGISAVAVRYLMSTAAAETAFSLKLPEAGPPNRTPSFEVFLALSQLLTLRSLLDEASARRMYPLFLEEPWGAHHIHSTYAQLLALPDEADKLPRHAHPALGGKLSKGQVWFASHLLTTWYLGIYYHERTAPVRVAYSEALMHDLVHPGIPQRFDEGSGFGAWGNPTKMMKRT
jgi:hypothetical protein